MTDKAEAEPFSLERFIKIMNMTTAGDGETLAAIRRANSILTGAGWDWERLLRGKVRVVENPFSGLAEPKAPHQARRAPPPPNTGWSTAPPPPPRPQPAPPRHSPKPYAAPPPPPPPPKPQSRSATFPFVMHIHTESRKALLVSKNNVRSDAVWVPKSQLQQFKELDGGLRCSFLLPDWLAYEKNLMAAPNLGDLS